MKRAKIALTAIGMFAIIGGALAFKSYRGITTFCRIGAPGVCTTTYQNTSFNPTNVGATYCTTLPGANCTQRASLFVQP